MPSILIELDDASAKELTRIAKVHAKSRAEFIRIAIRREIDRALERRTRASYLETPLEGIDEKSDLAGWDRENELAKLPRPKPSGKKARVRRAA